MQFIFQCALSGIICEFKKKKRRKENDFILTCRQAARLWPHQTLVNIVIGKYCKWVWPSSLRQKGEKVVSFYACTATPFCESIALGWLQFYLSNECTEIADITLCSKSNFILIDSVRFTKPMQWLSALLEHIVMLFALERRGICWE